MIRLNWNLSNFLAIIARPIKCDWHVYTIKFVFERRCIGQNWGEFEGNVLMFRYIIMRERRLELWGCSVISNEKKLSWNIIPNLRSKFSVWKGLTHTHCDRIVKWRRLYTWNQCWDSSHEAEQMSPAAYTSGTIVCIFSLTFNPLSSPTENWKSYDSIAKNVCHLWLIDM